MQLTAAAHRAHIDTQYRSPPEAAEPPSSIQRAVSLRAVADNMLMNF